MYWFFLIVAGIFEAGWLFFLDKSASFSKFPYVLLAVISMVISLVLFSFAIREIPITIAYLIWLAVGVCTIVLINFVMYQHSLTIIQLFFISLIIVGIIGLKLNLTNS
ncbi:multidrug efflux SMR transporter [Thalassotalea sp. 1_MG-2023]|uniref:multidrug efflux SMR transporter n=1 Tax=Thalassotalea sp. 1_MG-2023 TaxID=3062680 RepID=UPI0034A5C1D4